MPGPTTLQGASPRAAGTVLAYRGSLDPQQPLEPGVMDMRVQGRTGSFPPGTRSSRLMDGFDQLLQPERPLALSWKLVSRLHHCRRSR